MSDIQSFLINISVLHFILIPANFLNSDSYSIDIGIQNDRFEWIIWEKSILSFTIHETGEMKKEYTGKWAGVVRPKLKWATTII